MAELTYIWNGMFGIRLRISAKRSHGHSCKNRKATSKVAPRKQKQTDLKIKSGTFKEKVKK